MMNYQTVPDYLFRPTLHQPENVSNFLIKGESCFVCLFRELKPLLVIAVIDRAIHLISGLGLVLTL